MDSIGRQPASPDVEAFRQTFEALAANIESFIRGKSEVVRLALTCLLAEGHLLLEDVPGVAKTSLAKAIARSVSGTLKRIQFTPDLLPSDITGVQVYDLHSGIFTFRPGPVFANVLLGDEINRASPKAQSALLEAMAESQVTVDGEARPLPRPFLCIATQNPVDHEGTYSLPEAQLDRFTMRLSVGYPDIGNELEVIRSSLRGEVPETLAPVVDAPELVAMSDLTRSVAVSPAVAGYLVLLAHATRARPDVRLGVSPRGSVVLARCVQVRAASRGRRYATVDDVKDLAAPVLAHRLLLTPEATARGGTPQAVLAELLAELPVPGSATDVVPIVARRRG